jgi:hypothetical protein
MKQVTSWGSTNTRRRRILFNCARNLYNPAFTLWLLYSHWRSSSIHWTGGWVVLRVGLGAWEKNLLPLPVAHFVNSHPIIWAVTGKPQQETGSTQWEADSSDTDQWLWNPTRCARKFVCVSSATDYTCCMALTHVLEDRTASVYMDY